MFHLELAHIKSIDMYITITHVQYMWFSCKYTYISDSSDTMALRVNILLNEVIKIELLYG